MKELQHLDNVFKKERIEIEASIKAKQEFSFINSIKTKRGHRLWEILIKDNSIKEACYKVDTSIDIFDAVGESTKEVVRRKGCIYISALNQRNALKRYKENKGSSIIKPSDLKL